MAKCDETTLSLRVLNKFENFAGYTTINGLNRLFSSKFILGKLLWSILLIVCFGMMCYQIYELIMQFNSNQVNTKISLVYDDIYFPDVTFCNLNPLSYSKLKNDTSGQVFLKKLYTEQMHKDGYLNNLWQRNNNTEAITQGCGFANIDLVILLDSSSSIWGPDFDRSLNFLIALISKSDIENGSVRVGVLRFAERVDVIFNLNKYSTNNETMEAIGNIKHVAGLLTRTHEALNQARTVMFTVENGDRPEINNVIIIFTDGASGERNKTIREAELAKEEGIAIYVINVNNREASEELAVASSPKENYYFYVETYAALKGFENRIFATICPDYEGLLNIQMEFRQTLLLLARKMQVLNMDDGLNEFLLGCSFDGKPCNRSMIVSINDPFYGKCHRFPNKQIKVEHAGPSNALQLIINVNQDDYLPYIIDEAGLRLTISNYNETVSSWTDGISVATGFKTDVALRQKSKRMISKVSDCDDTKKFHNRHACREACIEDATQQKCNCSIVEKEGSNLKLSQCFSPQEMQCSWRLRKGGVKCNCKIPCSETKYEREMSFSTWPSRKYMPSSKLSAMSGIVEYSKQRDNFLMVNIYLSDLANEFTEEEPAFTVENFLSNIGGTLGLWIGMSVISIGEVLELLFILCRTVCRRVIDRDKEQSADKQDIADVGSKENKLDPCYKDFVNEQ